MREIDKMLLNACEIGDLKKVKQLLEKGADVNARNDEDGKTALMYAAGNDHKEVVELLKSYGAEE
jgi:ankyrin repeat protein